MLLFKYKQLLVRINHEAMQAKQMATYSYAPGETSDNYYLHIMPKAMRHFDLLCFQKVTCTIA